MGEIIKSIGCSVLIGSLVMGCSMSGGPGKSKQKEYITQGCVGGGLFGAVVASTLGGGDNVGKAALFGCGLGVVAGYQIAQRTDKYVDAKKAISAETQRNIATVNLVRNNNRQLANKISKYKSELARINRSKLSAQDKRVQLTAISKSLKEQLAMSKSNLSSVKNELTVTRGLYSKYKVAVVPQDKSGAYKQKITELETEKNILSKHVQSLNAMNATI